MVQKKISKPKKKKIKLSDTEKAQIAYQKEIVSLLKDQIGFHYVPRVNGTNFTYEGRTGELDGIYIYENIIVILEDTTKSSPGDHLLEKSIIFGLINDNPRKFIKFLYGNTKFSALKDYLDNNLLIKYSFDQIQVRIVYASKNPIPSENKALVPQVSYLDYSILKYFYGICKVIKSSSRHEFFDFLNIDNKFIAENILSSSDSSAKDFKGHILPEHHSSYDDGCKVITFYIDAESLLKRACVFRKDGWKGEGVTFYQRMLDPKKIRSMRKYLDEENRVFVNNIIATIPVDEVELYKNTGKDSSEEERIKFDDLGNVATDTMKIDPVFVKIKNKPNIIGIIDGQHRIYAYHEGKDDFEPKISRLRKIQNLLLTAVLFPRNKSQEERMAFEARLFLEINSNQQSAKTELKQAIEQILNPLSITSIAQDVLIKLNKSGPLEDVFAFYFYEKDKIKTSSIVSFGLKTLLNLDADWSPYKIWPNSDKEEFKIRVKEKKPVLTTKDYELLNSYKEFCVSEIRKLLIAFKDNIPKEDWDIRQRNTSKLLNITFINGIIHCLRFLIQNDKISTVEEYRKKLKDVKNFKFGLYTGSRYKKMGEELYKQFFA